MADADQPDPRFLGGETAVLTDASTMALVAVPVLERAGQQRTKSERVEVLWVNRDYEELLWLKTA